MIYQLPCSHNAGLPCQHAYNKWYNYNYGADQGMMHACYLTKLFISVMGQCPDNKESDNKERVINEDNSTDW